MKIRNRLTLYFILLIMSLLITRSGVTYYAIYRLNDNNFYERLKAKALTTATLLFNVRGVNTTLLKVIDNTDLDKLIDENVTFYDSTAHQIYTNNDTLNFKMSPTLWNEIKAKKEVKYMEGPYKIIGIYYSDKNNNAVVTAGAMDKKGNLLLSRLRLEIVVSLVISLLAVAIMGWLFVEHALEPIAAIIKKVRTLSPVNKGERLPALTENDEIAALVTTFNELFDKLEDSFTLEKSFVSNVSHELNNPLAKIKSQVEVSLIQDRRSESYRETLYSILEDINELIVLVQDLLNFSRLSSVNNIAKTSLRIDELIFDARELVLNNSLQNKVNISLENPPSSEDQWIIYGNKQLLIAAIKNVIENACKFSRDSSASVVISTKPGAAQVSITDNGPGIPARDIPHIFEAFYRSPSLEQVKGYGVGLALAHRIFKAHGFNIQVQSVIGTGTTFTILFSN